MTIKHLECLIEVTMQMTFEAEGGGKRVFIVEGLKGMRPGLAGRLRREAGPLDSGKAAGPRQSLQAILHFKPDIVLLDMPKAGKVWMRLIKQLKAANPQIKILAVCAQGDMISANRALRAGADGFAVRKERADELLHAVRDVLAGRLYVSERVLAASFKPRRSAGSKPRPAR